LHEPELTQGEAHILALLAQSSAADVADLHRGLAHKRSTLTSILDRLASRGLVTRKISQRDRRSFSITLTARGRKVARRVTRHLAGLERTVLKRVARKDLKSFNKVISALEREAQLQSSRSRR
jgi:DNA-binding MarR family transcriptional regulator